MSGCQLQSYFQLLIWCYFNVNVGLIIASKGRFGRFPVGRGSHHKKDRHLREWKRLQCSVIPRNRMTLSLPTFRRSSLSVGSHMIHLLFPSLAVKPKVEREPRECKEMWTGSLSLISFGDGGTVGTGESRMGRTESRRVGSSLSPLFRRVPAPVVASPLESHASYSRSVSVSSVPRLSTFVSSRPPRHGTNPPGEVEWVGVRDGWCGDDPWNES